MAPTAIFWFRRDLRIEDNIGLYYSVLENEQIIPVFVLDSIFIDNLKPDNPRLGFIFDAIINLEDKLKRYKSYLLLDIGNTEEVLKKLIENHNVQSLYFNKAHSYCSVIQEKRIEKLCKDLNVKVKKFTDSLLVPVEKVEVRKVFTPFFKLWLKEDKNNNLLKIKSIKSPKIKVNPVDKIINNIEYKKNTHWPIKLYESRLKKFDFCSYKDTRNFPYIDGTSRMSPYIRFGMISIRKLYNHFTNLGCEDQTYISEIAWREFWYHIMHNFPETRNIEFQAKRRGFKWLNKQDWLDAWKEGRTGYPFVDAGMRQLKEEGWIHNRVRMVVASFLTKDLIVDWRYGDRHFYDYLVDYDENVDIGNWQWAASVGADPKPLRIFNPILQSQRFDPDCRYIKKFIPELKNEEIEKIHDPIKHELKYYKPIVDHHEIIYRTKEIYNKSN